MSRVDYHLQIEFLGVPVHLSHFFG